MQGTHRSRVPAVLALLLLAAGLPALAALEEQRSFSSDELTVYNLIGEIRIEGHGGSDFEVAVHVRGDDAKEGLIQLETEEGASPELAIVFPLDQERSYVYPKMSGKSKTSFTLEKNGDSWLSALLGSISGKKITVRGSGYRFTHTGHGKHGADTCHGVARGNEDHREDED